MPVINFLFVDRLAAYQQSPPFTNILHALFYDLGSLIFLPLNMSFNLFQSRKNMPVRLGTQRAIFLGPALSQAVSLISCHSVNKHPSEKRSC